MRLVDRHIERRGDGRAVDLVAGGGDDPAHAEVGAGLKDVKRAAHIVAIGARSGDVSIVGPGAEVDDGLGLSFDDDQEDKGQFMRR